MNLCGFGDPVVCDLVDLFAFLGGLAGFIGLAGAIFFGIAYIRASAYAKPVVDSMREALQMATADLKTANDKASAAMEVATGRGAIERLVSDSANAHSQMLAAIQSHEKRAEAHDALIVQNLELIAVRLERKGDRRSTD